MMCSYAKNFHKEPVKEEPSFFDRLLKVVLFIGAVAGIIALA